jgi:DNA primase
VFQLDVNRFRCYACDVQGDAITLVQEVRKASFREAVEFLTELQQGDRPRTGSSAPGTAAASPSRGNNERDVYMRLYELSYELTPRSPGGRYLKSRGLDVSLANILQVGELEDLGEVWDGLVDDFGVDRLRGAGLVSRRGNFLFSRHRLLFFFFDGDLPRFVQARDLTGEASCKELSLAGLRSPVPYNVNALKQPLERVLLCEGCIDTLSAAQLGYSAVGIPGVTGFREEWFSLFHNCHHVTIAFDNDPAGRRQAVELRSRFRLRGIRADVQLPREGKDVNDLLKSLP